MSFVLEVKQKPLQITPSNTNHVFNVSSSAYTQTGFQFLVDVYFKGDLLDWTAATTDNRVCRLKAIPNTYGNAIVDKINILDYELTNAELELIDITDNLLWSSHTDLLAEFENSLSGGNFLDLDIPIISWQIYRREQGSSTSILLDTIDPDEIQYIDYTAQPQKTYIYDLFAVTATQISEPLETAATLSDFYGYFIIDPTTNTVFKFDMNTESAESLYAEDFTQYDNYTQYPSFARGRRKYLNTTITGIPATLTIDKVMSQTVDYIDSLRDFIMNGNEKIFKTRKGQIYRVHTRNFRFKPLNDAISEQPLMVSFDVIESSQV